MTAPTPAWSGAGRTRSSSANRARSTSGSPSRGWNRSAIEIEGIATHALNRWRALPDAPGTEAGGVNAIDKAFVVAEAVRELERAWTREQRYELLPGGLQHHQSRRHDRRQERRGRRDQRGVGPRQRPRSAARSNTTSGTTRRKVSTICGPPSRRAVLAACASDWWLRQHPPRFIWALRGLTNPPAETDPHAPPGRGPPERDARSVSPAAKATAMQGASLLPWYTRRGIPGVIFGPGNVAQAHGVDEFLDLEQPA